MTVIRMPPPKWLAYGIISLNILMNVGNFFVFDFPQALTEPLIRKLKIDTLRVEFLYSIYSMPNIVLSIVSGYFVSMVGIQKSSLIFSLILLFGQTVISLGMSFEVYSAVVLGRALYGIGGEGLVIVQPTINEYWFQGSLLSLSNGICEASNFMSLMLGNYLVPRILLATRDIQSAFFVMGLVAVFSCIFCIAYYFVQDKYDEYKSGEEEENQTRSSIHMPSNKNTKMTRAKNGAIAETVADGFKHKDSNIKLTPEDMKFGISGIIHLSPLFWLLCMGYLMTANSYYQFTNMATDILMYRFSYSFDFSQNLTIIPSFVIMVVSPFISSYVQKHGLKAKALLLSAGLMMVNYCIMFSLPARPSFMVSFCLALIGFCFGIVLATIYSCVALAVPHEAISVSYSLLVFMENFGLTIFPFMFSSLNSKRTVAAYDNCLIVLALLSLIGFVVCALLVAFDLQHQSLLDLPENSSKVVSIRKEIQGIYLRQCLERVRKNLGKPDPNQNMAHSPSDLSQPKKSSQIVGNDFDQAPVIDESKAEKAPLKTDASKVRNKMVELRTIATHKDPETKSATSKHPVKKVHSQLATPEPVTKQPLQK